jgi:glycosyltransferase involved in cell wall biosynthesis
LPEKKPRIVACIPAYNEEETIAKVVLKAQEHVDEVLVCDDGSTDMTAEIAERLGAGVIRHERNLGKGAALRSLFKAGIRSNADVLVTLDADGQHEANDIPKVIEPILKGESDVVVGNRFQHDDTIPAVRRWGNRALNFLTNLSLTSKVQDTQSGFRAYSRKALGAIDIVEDGLGVDSQILLGIRKKDLRIVEVHVSVNYPKNAKTSKKNFVLHGSEVILSIIELVTEKRSLLLLGVPGLLLSIFGTLSFVMVLKTFNETRQFAIGTSMLGIVSSLLGAILIFGALTFWLLGKRLNRLENRLSNRQVAS